MDQRTSDRKVSCSNPCIKKNNTEKDEHARRTKEKSHREIGRDGRKKRAVKRMGTEKAQILVQMKLLRGGLYLQKKKRKRAQTAHGDRRSVISLKMRGRGICRFRKREETGVCRGGFW